MENNGIIINSKISIEVKQVGSSKTPVMIIDNFAQNPQYIVDVACQEVPFKSLENTYYPGVRAMLPRDYVIPVLQKIYQEICQVYKIPTPLKLTPQETFFSLVTQPENDLNLLQRMPHFDTSRPFYFAILHYLNEREHGGTGFFRHKPTGFDKVDRHTEQQYLSSVQSFIEQHGETPKTYFTSSDKQFELYDHIEYKPNRLVIYPGHLLHSILISPEQDIDANPRTGRLTANIFIEFT